MEADQLEQLITGMPLLAHMEEEDRRRLTTVMEPVSFPESGAIIIREGDLGESLFFVVAGETFAEIKGQVVMRYEPGDYFGELSLLTGAPRKATVKAGPEGARCLLLTREVFDTLNFNEAMWLERQRMYEVANTERIQQFFATSSSEEDDSEDSDGSADTTPAEGVPPTSEQMLKAELARLRAANAELQRKLSQSEPEVEQAAGDKQLEAKQALLRSMEVVRSAQVTLEDSSREYTTSLQAQLKASAKQVAVLTAANTQLREALRGFADRDLAAQSSFSTGQQHATMHESEAIISQLRAQLATEREQYVSAIGALRHDAAEHQVQMQRMESALRDARRQHVKREWLMRDDVGTGTAAQHRLDNLGHELASGGYMPATVRRDDVGNIAPLGSDATLSSAADLMELVELVSKEF